MSKSKVKKVSDQGQYTIEIMIKNLIEKLKALRIYDVIRSFFFRKYVSDEQVKHITLSLPISGVKFSAKDYLGLMKNDPDFNYERFKGLFSNVEDYIITTEEGFRQAYDCTEAYTAEDCFRIFKNEQEMMVAIQTIGAEKILQGLNAELVDEESIVKTQQKAVLKNPELKTLFSKSNEEKISPAAFEKKLIEYKDTYRLHRVKKEEFSNKGMPSIDDDLLIVECVCPSKNSTFFLFVPNSEPQCQTAFGAIAWTFQDENGKPLSVEEWKILATQGEET